MLDTMARTGIKNREEYRGLRISAEYTPGGAAGQADPLAAAVDRTAALMQSPELGIRAGRQLLCASRPVKDGSVFQVSTGNEPKVWRSFANIANIPAPIASLRYSCVG